MLEKCLASLEEAKHALTFASGLGAQTAILSILSSEDHIVASVDIYGGTRRLFENYISRKSVEVTFADFDQYDNISRAIKNNTKMLWFESPTNPTLKIFDIEKIAKLAHDRGEIIVVLDNTFLTPYFQRPLELGVDISMYSLTKYLNGHSDVIMGAAVINDSELKNRLRYIQNCTGIIPSPHDCYLVNRSLKTLAIRLEQHQRNSIEVAKYLETHARVVRVFHPGLKSHPNHELFKKQARGHSGVLSFSHSGGRHESYIILSSVKIFAMAESLGGFESLIGLPTLTSHGSLDKHVKEAMGITENLIRLSIGLEDPEDLIVDLEGALKKAFPG
ncbi:cystathionine gamma-lyase-like [Hyposmocoma kahamanoa]|uniref:cystathionine gamma-lyase-like n=1 Tax=Hyposmocoma kahamanoa TaxID=1477025 RepID=UPI000E6DA22E|nr:cystathionine gamma-lyase-like [Hyposmocoma kahamanoa]